MKTSIHTILKFLDFSRAFNTVDHKILLRKLAVYGCSLDSLSWFRSYLNGRRHNTVVTGEVSSSKELTCGVLQGSPLGPLLFIVYMFKFKHRRCVYEKQS